MDPAREKMTPVDRIRDMERRLVLIERNLEGSLLHSVPVNDPTKPPLRWNTEFASHGAAPGLNPGAGTKK